MSYISHGGYGYSKKLCEDATLWFINNFFPRHTIGIDIDHKGLKRDEVVGYCDTVGDSYRPRLFLIELQAHMDREMYLKTLFHELTHLAQWVRGDLRFRYGKLCFYKEPVENYDYEHQPHEIEARREEDRLYNWYLNDKRSVAEAKVAQLFANRLTSAL